MVLHQPSPRAVTEVHSHGGTSRWPLRSPFLLCDERNAAPNFEERFGLPRGARMALEEGYRGHFVKLIDAKDPSFLMYVRDLLSPFALSDLALPGRLPVSLAATEFSKMHLPSAAPASSIDGRPSAWPSFNSMPIKVPDSEHIVLPIETPTRLVKIVTHAAAQQRALQRLVQGPASEAQGVLAEALAATWSLDLRTASRAVPLLFSGNFMYITARHGERTAVAPGLHIDGMCDRASRGVHLPNSAFFICTTGRPTSFWDAPLTAATAARLEHAERSIELTGALNGARAARGRRWMPSAPLAASLMSGLQVHEAPPPSVLRDPARSVCRVAFSASAYNLFGRRSTVNARESESSMVNRELGRFEWYQA